MGVLAIFSLWYLCRKMTCRNRYCVLSSKMLWKVPKKKHFVLNNCRSQEIRGGAFSICLKGHEENDVTQLRKVIFLITCTWLLGWVHVEDASQSLRYYSSKYEVKLILVVYIDLFLFLCGELSSFVFKDFQKYFLSHIFFLSVLWYHHYVCTGLNIRTPHPITGEHRDSGVSMHVIKLVTHVRTYAIINNLNPWHNLSLDIEVFISSMVHHYGILQSRLTGVQQRIV